VIVAMIRNDPKIAAMTAYTPDPQPDPTHKPEEPTTPGPPEPDEIPFTEPKHFPLHPEIPVQPIHEKDSARCLV
jgi:hypothetical protein